MAGALWNFGNRHGFEAAHTQFTNPSRALFKFGRGWTTLREAFAALARQVLRTRTAGLASTWAR